MKKQKRFLASILVMVMVTLLVIPFMTGNIAEGAKKKPKLSKRNITVKEKQTKTISVKNAKKAKKITWKSQKKKYVTVKKYGKTKAKIKGIKKGKSTITCKVQMGKKKYVLKCTVKVKKVIIPNTEPLKSFYAPIFENVGACLRYNESWNPKGERAYLQDKAIMNNVNKHYNSFTLENEMKPSFILNSNPVDESKPLTVAAAKKAPYNYVIRDSYKDNVVPKLDFSTLDKVLKVAYDKGIKMRAHTLIWHSQTPAWFFNKNYAAQYGTGVPDTPTTKTVMDGRMEFYIRTVMKRVYDSPYAYGKDGKPIVYAWDVVNEYLNSNVANWTGIYGAEGTSSTFVKKAFTIAKDVLTGYKLEDKVGLFYNDYNTYYNIERVISLINYINKDGKVCDGIGMQCHLDTANPSLSLVEKAVDKFAEAQFEIQITELDVTINFAGGVPSPKGHTDITQANYYGNLMRMLIQKKRSGANITGITWWGIYDEMSWRGRFSPLLFGNGFNDPKPSFYSVIEAAKKAG